MQLYLDMQLYRCTTVEANPFSYDSKYSGNKKNATSEAQTLFFFIIWYFIYLFFFHFFCCCCCFVSQTTVATRLSNICKKRKVRCFVRNLKLSLGKSGNSQRMNFKYNSNTWVFKALKLTIP